MLKGNGFMTTVTNIEIFSDHLVYYENVDVIVVVTVVGDSYCSWCS